MKKTALLLGLSIGLQLGAVHSGFAIQRKHRPWLLFSHHSSASSPAVSGQDAVDSPPVAAGNDGRGTDKGTQIAEQAQTYKGTRYKFGGTSKRGIDCSGLVTRVWEDLKMQKIPRASTALYNAGKPVHLSELRPGDLVFFKNTYKRGISHVGVYAGNNKFVHAANHSKGVTLTKLSDPYYQLHYAGARRLY